MYDNEEEIRRKRRNLFIIIGVVVFLILLLIIILILKANKKTTPKPVEKEISCSLGVKDGIQPNAEGVYTQVIEVYFESIKPENEAWKKKAIGTIDNSRNQETYKITKSGTYQLHGYLQDSTGVKKQCDKTFVVNLSAPSCTLEVKSGTLGQNDWYLTDVEVGFATMSSGSETVSIVKYYIEKEVTDLDTSKTIRADAPENNIEKYVVTDDQTTNLVGYVIDSNGMEGICKISVKKDSTKPSCKLKVVSGTMGSSGYTDNPVVGFSETTDTISDIAEKGVGESKTYDNDTYTVTKSGTTTVYGYVKDNAGNEETCSLEVKKASSGGSGGSGGDSTPQKTSNPSCNINASGTVSSGSTYLGNVTLNMTTSTTNGAKVTSYGLAETQTTNGKNTITITSAGKHTVYGMVKDSYGNVGYCEKEITIKSGTILANVAQVGQYVSYDAGSWSSTVAIPTKEGEFGGYKSGTTRSTGVNCLTLQENSPKSGWVVLSVANGKVTLVHAGTPECFKHYYTSSTSISKINARANTYLNSTYAESARILNCGDYGVTCTENTQLSDMHTTNTHYFLPTAKSNDTLWAVRYSGKVTGASDRAFGIRPVVVLKSTVVKVSGSGTEADPYKISAK